MTYGIYYGDMKTRHGEHERLHLAIEAAKKLQYAPEARVWNMYIYREDPLSIHLNTGLMFETCLAYTRNDYVYRWPLGRFCDEHDDCFADRELGKACYERKHGKLGTDV